MSNKEFELIKNNLINELQIRIDDSNLSVPISNDAYKELEEVFRKAKAFDEIRKHLIKEFEQEEPIYLADEYERGLYNAYYQINGIIKEHLERTDDER